MNEQEIDKEVNDLLEKYPCRAVCDCFVRITEYEGRPLLECGNTTGYSFYDSGFMKCRKNLTTQRRFQRG
jgi:hypothetical protein